MRTFRSQGAEKTGNKNKPEHLHDALAHLEELRKPSLLKN